jgi:uncharacterized membrane protein
MPSEQRPLHRRVEQLLQSGDMRLIYGIAVPLFVVIALIVALAISGRTILVIPLMLVVVVLTGVIMVGLNQMMSDDDEEDGEEDGGEDR